MGNVWATLRTEATSFDAFHRILSRNGVYHTMTGRRDAPHTQNGRTIRFARLLQCMRLYLCTAVLNLSHFKREACMRFSVAW